MRRNKGLKALVYSLVGTMVISNIAPAYAYTDSTGAVNETQEVTQTQDAECEVYAELGSEFKVIIPKKITLDGVTKTGAYTVSVEGDIAGTEYIKVVPDEAFTLTSTKLADVTATITQDKTEWLCGEIVGSGVIGNGAIDAQGITAGAWNGHFYFNVSLEETTGSGDESGTEDKNQLMLTLSDDEVLMGSTDTVQVNAYIEGENVNDYVSWESDNENIVVTEGLVETSSSAQVGDTATVTVTATSNASLFATDSEPLTATAQFTVTVIDMVYTTEGEDEVITSVDLEAGETKNIEVTIIPASVSGTVSWTTTAPAGINLVKNGNTVTVKIADDMAVGNTYNLVASYGNFSKLLTINIVAEEAHVHNYVANVTTEATCTTAGEKTLICECGVNYTETIPATGHVYNSTKYITDVTATCTTDGSKSVHCNVCGAKIVGTEVTIPATGHSYDTGVVTTEATCTTAGVRTYTCSCGDSYTEEISALGHKYNGNNCERCGIEAVAGLYDANGIMLCSWEESGIDSTCSNANSIIANNYPTTTKVLISDSVTSIGDNAFDQCSSLTSVTIPSSVTSIGIYAFRNCTSLTSVTIPSSVTSIGIYAFRNCTSLTSVTIPSSVASIKFYAFWNCSNLTSVTIEEGVTSIGEYAFNGCKSLTSVTIPSSVTSIGNYAFSGCTSLTSVTIPSSVTFLGNYTFNGCTSLTSVTIPSSVIKIGKYAFWNCSNLTSVTIPSSVTSIGINAFKNCTSLTSVTFKTTSGWYVGDSAGAKTTALSSSDLANKSTAATYLKSTYYTKYWTR